MGDLAAKFTPRGTRCPAKTPTAFEINSIASVAVRLRSGITLRHASIPRALFWNSRPPLLFASTLLLENLALHQQLSVLKRRHPRPRLNLFDRLFWLVVRHYWSGWQQALRIVTPETVIRWHRAGFRWYWKLISKVRKPTGRTPVAREVRDLIFQMVAENPTWGAPRIHGELLMLGLDVSAATCWIMSSRSMNTTSNGCCLSTSSTITKTARTLALRSKHRPAELPPRLPVGSCLIHDLEGCTIATIGPPN